ncbi:MAG TPA: site-specific integrase [Candidatus Saccharimonadales bacterium]|nr:site-specific integrase [Candidatus Saccharimonadales bacterium]
MGSTGRVRRIASGDRCPKYPHRRRGDYVEVDAAVAAGTASPNWSDVVEAFLRDARSRKCSPGNHRFSDTLQHYVRNERPADAKDRHLFLTTRRDRVTGDFGPLEAQGIKMLLRRVGQTTGIRVHAYRFRNTFGVRAVAAGVDSVVLQRALGHATPAMVNRYAHFQARDPLEAWRARSD